MGTVREVTALREEAMRLGLSGADHCARIPLDTLAAMYNGIGPEWMPESLRKKLSKKLATYAPATLVHDVRFAESDGSTLGFNMANAELEVNCAAIADDKYAWYNPLRYFARRVGVRIADACRLFGWSAWMDAFKARTGKQ